MADKTTIQRIQELDRERTALFESAKDEALRKAHQAIEDLNALGLNYRLVEGAAPGSKSAGKKQRQTSQAGAEKKRPARPPG